MKKLIIANYDVKELDLDEIKGTNGGATFDKMINNMSNFIVKFIMTIMDDLLLGMKGYDWSKIWGNASDAQ